MITFAFNKSHLDRLSRLALAADDSKASQVLGHIALRIAPELIRFSSTNGRLLVSLLVSIGASAEVEDAELILDADQFTAAMKSLVRSTASSVQVTILDAEARFTSGVSTAIVRRVPGVYPAIDHAWSKTKGAAWAPTLATLDPVLVGVAQKVIGKGTLLFSSPVTDVTPIAPLWGEAKGGANAPALSDLAALVRAPAYWSDGQAAVLLMPITRTATGPGMDLTPFAAVGRPMAMAA